MKLKAIFQTLGLRGTPRHYGYQLHDFDLGDGVRVRYAQWLHPSESGKEITRAQVETYAPYLSSGDFAIDIGAHSGDSTLPMAIAVGSAGCVLALEPNPFLYHVLEKNARANRGIATIESLLAAAVPEEGFLQFEYSDAGFCNGGRHEGISILQHGHPFKLTVFGVDLARELTEDYADRLPRLRFIKTDAEGFDLQVLRSLGSIIDRYRPTIKAEVFSKTDRRYRRELLDFFHQRSYRVHKITAEPVGIGPLLDESMLENWRHYDVLAIPETIGDRH